MAIGQERDVMLAGRGMEQSEPMSKPRLKHCHDSAFALTLTTNNGCKSTCLTTCSPLTDFMTIVGLRLSWRYETSSASDIGIAEHHPGQAAHDALPIGKNFLKCVHILS